MAYSLQYIDIISLQHDLLEWYDRNKRVLPWRDTGDPYKIWVSEIMLQQTQVKTVIPYFEYFMERFPTVYDLAAAEKQTVLKAWEGLGYYSRARNLQSAAQDIVARFDGVVPNDRKSLDSLKGIGPYTRGAILSIAFNQPEPAVDGNVMRVIARLLRLDDNIAVASVKKRFEKITRSLIPEKDPSSFNQALMELGALVCVPNNPLCSSCPVQSHCQAYQSNQVSMLPVKSKQKQKRTVSYAAVLLRTDSGHVVIEQRGPKGLLANMWQFPMVPIGEVGGSDVDPIKTWLYNEYGIQVNHLAYNGHLQHVFTHKIWELSVYTAEVTADSDFDSTNLHLVGQEDLQDYPFPVSHQKMMTYLDISI